MPEPPSVALHVRWLFENPWPIGGMAVVAAIVIGWLGLRDGIKSRIQIATALFAVGAAVFTTATLVTTAGEHALRVTRDLVRAAVAGDPTTASSLFSPNSSLSFGRPENPGVDFSEIQRRLNMLGGRYRVNDNTVTSIDGYTESADAGTVHLSCLTTVAEGYGPTPSSWIVRVKRQSDGAWLISRITLVSAAGQRGADVFH